MITLYEKAYSFTRPNDTTAYASGDLVANSTTANQVVSLSWGFPPTFRRSSGHPADEHEPEHHQRHLSAALAERHADVRDGRRQQRGWHGGSHRLRQADHGLRRHAQHAHRRRGNVIVLNYDSAAGGTVGAYAFNVRSASGGAFVTIRNVGGGDSA